MTSRSPCRGDRSTAGRRGPSPPARCPRPLRSRARWLLRPPPSIPRDARRCCGCLRTAGTDTTPLDAPWRGWSVASPVPSRRGPEGCLAWWALGVFLVQSRSPADAASGFSVVQHGQPQPQSQTRVVAEVAAGAAAAPPPLGSSSSRRFSSMTVLPPEALARIVSGFTMKTPPRRGSVPRTPVLCGDADAQLSKGRSSPRTRLLRYFAR